MKPKEILELEERFGVRLSLSIGNLGNYNYILSSTNQVIGLSLGGCTLTDIAFLRNFPLLQKLTLNSNQISDISVLQHLTQLTRLNLSGNQISDISALYHLTQLTRLNLSGNQISDISALYHLTQLTRLNLDGNQISDISALYHLTQLTRLNLDGNQISDITGLQNLFNLKVLNLNNNEINIIPSFGNLTKITRIGLKNNPLIHLPIGIVNQGKQAILKYFEDMANIKPTISPNQNIKTDKHLYEAKLIIIGNGEVGKSSIRTKLMDRAAPLPTLSTHGIDTFEWVIKVPHNGEVIDFKLNIWDFGGQGEYRAVQQFFCTRNSIYLYVTSYDDEATNDRDEYVGFDYWYPFVQAYGYDDEKEHLSPMLHIRNKKDKKVLPLDENIYQKMYPKIYSEYLQVSCTTLENIDRLEEVIKNILPDAGYDMFTRQYPSSWLSVKATLERMRKKTYNYISFAEYIQICKDNGMDEEAAEVWLKELDNIGTVNYFGKIKNLAELVIINPEWLKEAAYRILKKQDIRKNYGVFRDFSEVWKGGIFPKELHPKLEDLMLAFEICFIGRDERNKPAYYVPAMFPSREEQEKNKFFEMLEEHGVEGHLYEFVLTYDLYMPAGLLHRLMVRHNKETQNQYRWRDCAILHFRGTYAEIVEDWKGKRVLFKIKGSKPSELFRFIRNAIDRIGKELEETKFIKPLTYQITAFYDGDFETIKSLKKMSEAKELFGFLFEKDEKGETNQATVFKKESSTSTELKSFKILLLSILDDNQQNAISDILTKIKESSFQYNRVKWEEIDTGLSPMGITLMASSLVQSTKALIGSLSE